MARAQQKKCATTVSFVPKWAICACCLVAQPLAAGFFFPPSPSTRPSHLILLVKPPHKDRFSGIHRSADSMNVLQRGFRIAVQRSNIDAKRRVLTASRLFRVKAAPVKLTVAATTKLEHNRRLASDSASDFLSTLFSEIIASAIPMLGGSVAVKAALYGVFGNMTSTVLVDGTNGISEVSPKSAACFVVRNAVLPAICHQMVCTLVDDVIHGCSTLQGACLDIGSGLPF